MLNGHGDDGYRHNKQIVADFSTNVWYGGSPDGLKSHLFANWDKIHKYPEVTGESLTDKIAAHYGMNSDQFLVANGSTESIYLIAQTFKGKKSAIVIPAFAEYEDACVMHEHQVSYIAWEDLRPDMALETDVLFICNPNNPTGAAIDWLSDLIIGNPETVFVVDEAFIEFTVLVESVVRLTKNYNNLIVMRSMTKAYAIPGLRLGYIVSSTELIQHLKRLKLPWTVNVPALEAGHFIFDHYDKLQLPIESLLQDKEAFIKGLSAVDTLKITASKTHFFIADTTIRSAPMLKLFLLKEFNILIRDASNFRGLGTGCIRLATLDKVKNELLIKALLQWK